MESLLIGVLSSQDVSSQMDYMNENYADDVRTGYNVALLHTHKARTDIRLLDVANEFVQRNENRFCNFGKFTDLDLSTC